MTQNAQRSSVEKAGMKQERTLKAGKLSGERGDQVHRCKREQECKRAMQFFYFLKIFLSTDGKYGATNSVLILTRYQVRYH